jgi:hypothetical protein
VAAEIAQLHAKDELAEFNMVISKYKKDIKQQLTSGKLAVIGFTGLGQRTGRQLTRRKTVDIRLLRIT